MALKFLGEMLNESKGKKARVYKDTDYEEHRVKFYVNEDYQTEADYHCPDFQDAVDTANHWLHS